MLGLLVELRPGRVGRTGRGSTPVLPSAWVMTQPLGSPAPACHLLTLSSQILGSSLALEQSSHLHI